MKETSKLQRDLDMIRHKLEITVKEFEIEISSKISFISSLQCEKDDLKEHVSGIEGILSIKEKELKLN